VPPVALRRAGQESPYRNRQVEDSLDLFARMRAGELRKVPCFARQIDMASVTC